MHARSGRAGDPKSAAGPWLEEGRPPTKPGGTEARQGGGGSGEAPHQHWPQPFIRAAQGPGEMSGRPPAEPRRQDQGTVAPGLREGCWCRGQNEATGARSTLPSSAKPRKQQFPGISGQAPQNSGLRDGNAGDGPPLHQLPSSHALRPGRALGAGHAEGALCRGHSGEGQGHTTPVLATRETQGCRMRAAAGHMQPGRPGLDAGTEAGGALTALGRLLTWGRWQG